MTKTEPKKHKFIYKNFNIKLSPFLIARDCHQFEKYDEYEEIEDCWIINTYYNLKIEGSISRINILRKKLEEEDRKKENPSRFEKIDDGIFIVHNLVNRIKSYVNFLGDISAIQECGVIFKSKNGAKPDKINIDKLYVIVFNQVEKYLKNQIDECDPNSIKFLRDK